MSLRSYSSARPGLRTEQYSGANHITKPALPHVIKVWPGHRIQGNPEHPGRPRPSRAGPLRPTFVARRPPADCRYWRLRPPSQEHAMDRRRFLAAGSGLATLAGVSAGASPWSARAAPAARSTPTVFDFGAVGDGHTDDSGAFEKALQHAAANGVMVIVPAGTYAVARTIAYKSEG
ncbi:MAG: hypothetical protein JO128_24780, partial [Alphaproteobacteria bacterium]|nr:hypothetical protein [Alphaproteobacteria bacterium]